MKRVTAIFLCAVLTALLSFTAFAEGDDHTPELAPPRVFIEPDDGCVNVYIDGITADYFSSYSEKYVEDINSIRMYALDVSLGSIWTGSHYYFLSFINPDDITTPYRIDAQHTLPYNDGEDIVYEETEYELTYYVMYDGELTSGYLFKVFDKDAAENLTQEKYVDTAIIAAYADEEGKDCIAGSWVSYFGGPEGENGERLNITFLEKADADIPSEPAKASPDTGITDIAAIAGLSVLAAGAAMTIKKR